MLTLIVGFISLSANALSYNLWYDGFWHGWDDFYDSVSGTYDDLIFYNQADGISHYTLRITINDFVVPDKKIMKECKKITNGLIIKAQLNIMYVMIIRQLMIFGQKDLIIILVFFIMVLT